MSPDPALAVWRLAPEANLLLRVFEDAAVAYETGSGDTLCFPPAGADLVRALEGAGAAGLSSGQLQALADGCELAPEQLDYLLAELQARGLALRG